MKGSIHYIFAIFAILAVAWASQQSFSGQYGVKLSSLMSQNTATAIEWLKTTPLFSE